MNVAGSMQMLCLPSDKSVGTLQSGAQTTGTQKRGELEADTD